MTKAKKEIEVQEEVDQEEIAQEVDVGTDPVVIRSHLEFAMHFPIEGGIREVSFPGKDRALEREHKTYECHESVANLSIVPPRIFAILVKDRMFSSLLKEGKFERLDNVPDGYVSATAVASRYQAEAEQAKNDAAKAKSEASAKDKEIAELRAKLAALGQ